MSSGLRLSRTFGLIFVLTGIALAMVFLRAEQARTAANSLALEAKWVELRRELWTLQAEVARLRTPSQLRDRIEYFTGETAREQAAGLASSTEAKDRSDHPSQG